MRLFLCILVLLASCERGTPSSSPAPPAAPTLDFSAPSPAAQEQEKPLGPLARLLPEDREGFYVKEGPPTEYMGRLRLFNYIDGGAETYLKYGCRGVATAVYLASFKAPFTLDVFDMGSAAGAEAVFIKEEVAPGLDPRLGDRSILYDGALYFSLGRYYVKITAGRIGDDTLEDLRLLGDAQARILAGKELNERGK